MTPGHDLRLTLGRFTNFLVALLVDFPKWSLISKVEKTLDGSSNQKSLDQRDFKDVLYQIGKAGSQSKLGDLNECLDGVPFTEALLNGLTAIQACDQSDKFQQRAYICCSLRAPTIYHNWCPGQVNSVEKKIPHEISRYGSDGFQRKLSKKTFLIFKTSVSACQF